MFSVSWWVTVVEREAETQTPNRFSFSLGKPTAAIDQEEDRRRRTDKLDAGRRRPNASHENGKLEDILQPSSLIKCHLQTFSMIIQVLQ